MNAPCPKNETQRLAVLRSYRVLDTDPEDSFDRLTRLAARLLDAPICLVSLVDERRQFFKSCVGLDVRETERDVSVCAHNILTDEPMVVEDALEDERFRENALVRKGVFRSYAGAPLVTSCGHRLGSFCVLDTVPRAFSIDEVELLETFAQVVVDELELRVSKECLELALDEARRADSVRRAFINNISHELRTPLTAIVGFAEMLAESDTPPEERRALSRTIRAGSDRLLGVVEDVLDYARIEGGSVEFEDAPFEINEAIRRGVETLRPLAKQRSVRLDATTPHEASRVIGDEARLRQAVDRLVETAINLSVGGSVGVELRCREGHGRVRVDVRVQARGAPSREGDCRRLAEALTTEDEVELSGPMNLGVSIAKRLVALMNGELSADADGSTATIRLRVAFPAAERGSGAREPMRIGPHQLHSLRVLVVEDGPDNQLLLRMLLEKAGATVEVAANGAEALEMAGPLAPHVILMDLQMPVMDGFEATRRLRERGHRGPIIAVTANASDEDRRRCELAGFDFFLSKPVNRGELYERCASLGRAA